MSSQHRRSKVNHSVIVGPELTQSQQNLLKKRQSLESLILEELSGWVEVCQLHESYWKNRRSLRKSWQFALEKAKEELEKREKTFKKT